MSSSPEDLFLHPTFDQVLGLEKLTPTPTAFDPKWVSPKKWPQKVSCRFQLRKGVISAASMAPEQWRIGPRGSKNPQSVEFAQIVRYEVFGNRNTDLIRIEAQNPLRDGDVQSITFKRDAHLTISHLCAFEKNDGNRVFEEDILVFAKMVTQEIPLKKLLVFHAPESALADSGGIKTRTKVDTCPPVRGY